MTKRSLQNTWLNHPLLYKSSWMGITNPVFVQLHFLECFSQASARDSVYIVYRVCKCYQLFEKSIKCRTLTDIGVKPHRQGCGVLEQFFLDWSYSAQPSMGRSPCSNNKQHISLQSMVLYKYSFSFLLAWNILSGEQFFPGARYLLGEEVVKRKVIVQLLLENQVLCWSFIFKKH